MIFKLVWHADKAVIQGDPGKYARKEKTITQKIF